MSTEIAIFSIHCQENNINAAGTEKINLNLLNCKGFLIYFKSVLYVRTDCYIVNSNNYCYKAYIQQQQQYQYTILLNKYAIYIRVEHVFLIISITYNIYITRVSLWPFVNFLHFFLKILYTNYCVNQSCEIAEVHSRF